MNVADYIVLALAAIAAFRGWRQGLVGQVFELGGGFIGLLAGVALGPRIAASFTEDAGLGSALLSLVVVFVALSVGQTLGYMIGHRFGLLARRSHLGAVNSILGVGFGILITFVSYWLIGSLLVTGPSRDVARLVRRSKILGALNNVSQPPDVIAQLRQYLETSGFPQVFVGLPRPLAEPVDLPPRGVARQAAKKAQASTVRIVVPACGGTQLGSGWVAAESTVVTNAHVVAGGDDLQVQDSAGSHTGSVVVFDPDTDVAVIHVDGLAGPSLPLKTDVLERGAPGATLGFPGESAPNLDVDPAAVQDAYRAVGRDIYGRGEVTREVYELRAEIRQGESGGPFVLPTGDVAGVVFAASTTDGRVGYALTGPEVANQVRRGSGKTTEVSTGACTH